MAGRAAREQRGKEVQVQRLVSHLYRLPLFGLDPDQVEYVYINNRNTDQL